MKIFYHRDMDGKCSAAIVYQASKHIKPTLIGIDYKDDVILKDILSNEVIWIVDFSFKPDVMEKILAITKNVFWIDHHKTAMEYKYSQELDGIRDISLAGCELTWKFLHPEDEVPLVVAMLGRYDVWDFSLHGNNLNKLQTGIRLWDTDPSSKNWERWLSSSYKADDELLRGTIALQYRDSQYASLIKAWSFWSEFEGYKAICCNAGCVSSQLFDTIKDDYDLMIPFVFDGKQWTVSLYTKKDIDCSEIAKKYGGGGHKKASGFQCKELPFVTLAT